MPRSLPVGRFHAEAVRKAEANGFPDNLWYGSKAVRRYNDGNVVEMSVPAMERLQVRINGLFVKLRPSTHELATILILRGPRKFTTRAEIVDMLYAYAYDGGPLSADRRVSQMLLELSQAGVPFEVYCGWGVRIANEFNA